MIRSGILAFALGAATLQLQPALPGLAWLGTVLPWLVLIPLWLGRARPGAGWPVLVVLLAGLAGFYYAAWRAEARLADHLPDAWEGRPISLTGRIVDLPERTPRGWRARIDVSAVHTRGAQVPRHILVAQQSFKGEPPPAPAAGSCLRLSVKLYAPHANLNPHGFDYEAWLLERGIRATGVLIDTPASAQGCDGLMRAWLDRQRDRIRARLVQALEGQPYAGVVIALAIGDQAAIPSAQWTLFRHTGVTHLMSISGMHVTLFSALVYALVTGLWRRVPGLCLRLPARKAGLALGLAAAAAYVALAGFGIPAQRTLYMLAGVAACLWLGLVASPTRILAAALLFVVVIDPWAALAPGFWLSFGAVAALMYAGSGRLRPPPWWLAAAKTQAAVTLALTPALLALFHELSLVSPLANAFAIPLIGLIAVPLTLLAMVMPGDSLAGLAHGAVALTMWGLIWLDSLPQPVWYGAHPGWPAIALALLGTALLLLPRGLPGRALGLVLFLPLLSPRLERPGAGEFWLSVLDVGQGLAAVVRTAGHTLVYDTGPLYVSGEDAGARIVAPYLHAQGIKRLDALVVSHDDTDHSGGTLGLLANLPAAAVWTSLAGKDRNQLSPHAQAILAANPGARVCRAGTSWRWDGVAFTILHPPAHHYANRHYADNERSCVLKVGSPHGSVLLLGDIERLGELSLLERSPAALSAEVLIAAHHGSRSSSMPELLDAVGARYGVISAGHRNRFGHPAPEVLQRFTERGMRILRTDRQGAVELRFTTSGIVAHTARDRQRRYWHRVFPNGAEGATSPTIRP